MTNDNHKCEACGGIGMIYKQSMDSVGKVTSYGYKCDCRFPKPLPSEPKCEHETEDGLSYVIGEKPNRRIASKTDYPSGCPFCKPVECQSSHCVCPKDEYEEYDKNGNCVYCGKMSDRFIMKCECESLIKIWKIKTNQRGFCRYCVSNPLPVEPSVDIKKDCWLFTGRIEKSGYGRKGGVSAHRLSYQTFVGKIPKGKFVLHKCDVRNCINPNHLYLGTSKDNMRDCLERGRHPRLNRNSCGRGHPYTKDTIQYKYSRGQKYRYCKECEYIKRKQRQENKRLRNERNRK